MREFIFREAMMNTDWRTEAEGVRRARVSPAWLVAIAALLLAAACGGEPPKVTQQQYPALTEDVAKQLKYDARVEDYEEDGDRLVVNVNEAWLSSPPGMQERAVGQWFALWRSSLGNAEGAPRESIQVVVRHDGNEVAKWTGKDGYQPIARPRQQPAGGES
jgi:hypothetical protein